MRLLSFALLIPCAIAGESFEVASVKLHILPVQMVGMTISGARVTFSAMSLTNLVAYAWHVQDYQVLGGPGWSNSDRWDIAGKAEGDDVVARDKSRRMLQALLTDRFHVQAHREMKEMPVYALVRGRNAPNLRENNDPNASYGTILDSPKRVATTTTTKGTMEQLAGLLTVNCDRPVFDETGVAGTWDYKLEWEPGSQADSNVPDIFTAVQEQLGLKLEPAKRQVEIVVIDRAERPSAN